jgi:DNA helicase-2/ATP-dependent DNA helicase PcrA
MVTGEISTISSRAGTTYKVHSLLLFPDLDAAAALSARLDTIGNVRSDGRPILGLDPCALLRMVLAVGAVLVPAHIWTPWFSLLGSRSGFDSPEACFGDLTPEVFAVETGLSSDPPMNWRVSALDRFALVSNSDLHSPRNLARNATWFHGEPGYETILDALRTRDGARLGGTLDLFPEQGKYHFDGHRKCGVAMAPDESLTCDARCPACGKPLVLGVLHRVTVLADRPEGHIRSAAPSHEYLIPLPDLLGELLRCGPGTKTVARAYDGLLARFGPELHILRTVPCAHLERADVPRLAEAVAALREGRVRRTPGYDGLYGRIRVLSS